MPNTTGNTKNSLLKWSKDRQWTIIDTGNRFEKGIKQPKTRTRGRGGDGGESKNQENICNMPCSGHYHVVVETDSLSSVQKKAEVTHEKVVKDDRTGEFPRARSIKNIKAPNQRRRAIKTASKAAKGSSKSGCRFSRIAPGAYSPIYCVATDVDQQDPTIPGGEDHHRDQLFRTAEFENKNASRSMKQEASRSACAEKGRGIGIKQDMPSIVTKEMNRKHRTKISQVGHSEPWHHERVMET